MSAQAKLKARELSQGRMIRFFLLFFIQVVFVFLLNISCLMINGVSAFGIGRKAVKAAVLLFLSCFLACGAPLLSYGADRCRFEKVKCGNSGVLKMFSFFSIRLSFKALKLGLCVLALRLCFAVAAFAPAAASTATAVFALKRGCSAAVALGLLVCTALLFVLGGVLYFRLGALLFLCRYFFVDNPSLRAGECVERSASLMKRNIGRLFALRLSFLFWFLSCLLIIPVPYVVTFYKQTQAVMAFEFIYNS